MEITLTIFFPHTQTHVAIRAPAMTCPKMVNFFVTANRATRERLVTTTPIHVIGDFVNTANVYQIGSILHVNVPSSTQENTARQVSSLVVTGSLVITVE